VTADDEVVALYLKEAGRLRGFLIKLGASPELADDCVQDAFLVVAHCYVALINPLAYAYKVARHQLIADWRRARRESPTDLREDVVDDRQAEMLSRREEHAAVHWALDRMRTGRAKEAIILRYLRGFSVKDTAMIMGISRGAVKRYAHDGLSIVRGLLEDDGGREETR
jgi:RNA polymerase sigma-70 factor, ECF subfamily